MAATAEHLEQVDAVLDALEVDEQRARDAVSVLLANRPVALADVDQALDALSEGLDPAALDGAFTAREFPTEELSVSDLEPPSAEVEAPASPRSVPPPVPTEAAPSEPAPAAAASSMPPPVPTEAAPSEPEPALDADSLFGDVDADEGQQDLDDELGALLDDDVGISIEIGDENEQEPDGFEEEDATGLFTADDLAMIQAPAAADPVSDDVEEIELLIDDDDFDLLIDDGELDGVLAGEQGEGTAEDAGEDDPEKGFFKKLFG